MGRCAAAGVPASVGNVSAPSQGLSERPVRSVPPAQVSVALKGTHRPLRRDFWLVGRAALWFLGDFSAKELLLLCYTCDEPQASLLLLGAHTKHPDSVPGRAATSLVALVLMEIHVPVHFWCCLTLQERLATPVLLHSELQMSGCREL